MDFFSEKWQKMQKKHKNLISLKKFSIFSSVMLKKSILANNNIKNLPQKIGNCVFNIYYLNPKRGMF